MKKVTLQEIADEIGVSRITISKVINNRPGVSEKTRKRIVNALMDHNYKNISRYADSVQQHVHTDTKQTIGVLSISPDFSTFWLEIIQAISGELNFHSQDVVFFFLARNKQGVYELPQGVDSERLNGLVVINVYDEYLINQISATKIPTVYFDLPPHVVSEYLPGDVVYVEGRNSVRKITESLIDAGYKKLAYIGDIHYAQTMNDRWRGFLAAHEAKGLEPDKRLTFLSSPEFNFYDQAEIDSLIANIHELPEAFVCGNDDLAKRVLNALKSQHRLDVDSIVLTGYDGLNDPETQEYLFSTVKVDTKALGLRLVRQILQRISHASEANEQIYIEGERIIHKNKFPK